MLERQETMRRLGILLMAAWGLALGATAQPPVRPAPGPTDAPASQAASSLPAAVRPSNRPVWRTPTYTLVARDMDLRTALDSFAVAQGLSVVMSDAVSDLQYMKAGELRTLLADLGVEDSRFPLRTASNDELIMVSGPPRYVAIVSETVAKADKLRELRTFNEVEVRIFPLIHTWADDVLKPAAELAFAGDGNFLCGEWCGFCKAKNACRARADANLELAKYDFKLPPLLTDEDVEDILGKIDDLVSWASDIKEYALAQAISGKQWSGFKLVEGRSNRRYVNDAAVAAAVTEAGFDPYEQKLLGITAMQKMLGKARFDEVLSGLIEKPQGKPTLVPESDKRPAMNTAITDFKDNGGK